MFNHATAPTPLDLRSAIVRDPLVVSPHTTVMTAIAKMSGLLWPPDARPFSPTVARSTQANVTDLHRKARSSCVMVATDSRLLGILTSQDVVLLAAQQVNLSQMQVTEVMTSPAITLKEAECPDVFNAIELLQRHRISHLPILDPQEHLVGLVTYESLLHALSVSEPPPGLPIVSEWHVPAQKRLYPDDHNDEVKRQVEANLRTTPASRRPHTWPGSPPQPLEQPGTALTLQQEAEAKFQAIFEQATVGMVMASPDGRLIQVNQKVCDWLGYAPEELLGLHLMMIRHPDYRKQAAQHLVRLSNGESQPLRGEEIFLGKDGTPVWLDTSINLIRDQTGHPQYFLGVLEDVSDRKRILAKLTKSEQLFRATFEQAAVGIAQVSPEGDFICINQRFCEIVGYPLEELITLSFLEITHPKHLAVDQMVRDRMLAGELQTHVAEKRYLGKGGRIVWANVTISLVRQTDGAPDYFIAVIEDISDRKQVEEALQNLIAGTAATTGQNFFPALAQHIASALNVSHVMVSERVEQNVQTLAYWANDTFQTPIRYSLDHTPCARTLAKGSYFCEHSVQTEFPQDLDLVTMGVESYLGVALRDSEGDSIGILCVLDKQPIQEPERATQILQVFAARATAELERQQANALLQQLNQDLETKVKDRTAKLKEREQFLKTLLDALPLSIFWKDRHSVYLGCNRHFLRDAGLPSDADIIGKTDDDLPWEKAESFRTDDHEVMDTAQAKLGINEMQPQANGQQTWLETHKVPLYDLEGTVMGVLGAYRDISDRKQAELELTHTNEKLARATRLKDEFLANMSHELRTPLNAILGMTEGLQEQVFGDINRRQLKALQTIENSGSHLLELINDILDLSKIESGQIELDLVSTAIAPLCQASLAFVKQQALKKNIQLETKLPLNLPNILVDERRLRQVLINLLNNAVKFTPEGGCITLEFKLQQRPTAPELQRSSPITYLQIAIADTGIGIATEHLDRLFQPFVQIDSALNRKYEGTGLGLALVKRIVELHGGQVTVTSEVGVGSCFTIDLPYTATANTAVPQETSPEPSSELSPPEQPISPLILLAEDNEANIVTVSSYLTAKGYRMLLANDGQEAIDLAQAENPDLILMDIQMPGMDGLEAMRHIRQVPSLVRVPIVALTALAMKGDRERCIEAGANDYLSKPVKLKQLATTIQQLLTPI